MKPVVGMTTFVKPCEKKVYATVSTHYIRSVELAGGLPIMLPLLPTADDAQAYLDTIDALLLTGGDEDVSPILYGENPCQALTQVSPERDAFEAELVRGAMERKMPILAICRGVQILNVTMGGTLYQDIYSQCDDCLGHSPKDMPVDTLYHEVTFEEGSTMESIFGATKIQTNSFHHQAIKEVAEGFKATGHSSEGIIEAIEYTGDAPVIGVQWHPEDLTVKHPEFVGLFKYIVDAAKKK